MNILTYPFMCSTYMVILFFIKNFNTPYDSLCPVIR